MLGKLFNLNTTGAVMAGSTPPAAAAGSGSSSSHHATAAAGTRPPPEVVLSLESVHEDLHTRSLLYPDAQALLPSRHDQLFALPDSPRLPPAAAAGLASAFDLDPDLDLDARDVRVLVLQDGIGSASSCLLYDSHPRPPTPPPPTSPSALSAPFAAAPPPPAAGPNRPHTVGGSGGGNLSHLSHALQDSPARRMAPPAQQRKPSLTHAVRPVPIQPDSPQRRPSQSHARNPSRTHVRTQSRQLDPDGQRAAREYADEISIFSSCIFGTSELLAYRGTSTKVHVLPSDARQADPFSPASASLPYSAVLHDGGRGSLGRSSMRSSKLSQSFSSESAFFPPPPNSSSSSLGTSASSSRQADRKRVLITRLFPVTVPADDEGSSHATTPMTASPFRASDDGSAAEFPFPADGYSDGTPKGKKRPKLKQKRTPMYAIALIVSLPQPPQLLSAAMRRSSSSRSAFPGPSSYPDHQDQLSSSYGSARRTGWPQSGLGHDPPSAEPAMLGSPAFGATTDLEERMDPVTQHWDVIMRALTEMQAHVSARILSLLRAMDVSSPGPQPWPPTTTASNSVRRTPSSAARRRGEDGMMGPPKPAKTNATLLWLAPNAFAAANSVAADADRARARIATGLRALRVITGQNRWGIWREEARWVAHRAASTPAVPLDHPLPDRELFLHNLLTAFLATHTDWLRALGPTRARQRHLLLDASRGSDDALPARTIVVARDKTVARRIVFLLSAFLPAAPGLPGGSRARRPSTAMSWAGGLSQSPPVPSAMPASREPPLRRQMNRHGPSASGRRSSHLRNLSLQGPGGGASDSLGLMRTASMSAAGVPAPLAHLHERRGQHDRRPSDAGSVRTAHLPFTGADVSARKSSAALTSTVASDATVPHFATMQRSTSAMSASSAAADDLKRTLLRVDSNSSTGGSPLSPLALLQQQARGGGGRIPAAADARNDGPRWGGLLSGFLGGGRRREAPSAVPAWDLLGLRRNSDAMPPSPGYPPSQRQAGGGPVAGAHLAGRGDEDVAGAPKAGDGSDSPRTPQLAQGSPRLEDGRAGPAGSAFRPIPGASSAFDSPVRATADADDGAIEVDISFPDYLRSFETAVSSPSTSGFLSTPGGFNGYGGGGGFGSGLDAFEQSCRVPVGGGLPANVAGWLPSYHRDFCLQAVPPQEQLLEQIKASLREEPSPGITVQDDASDRWVDVASAVVVDAGRRTVTRVQYSRRLRPKARGDASPPGGGYGGSYGISTPHLQPEVEMEQLEERFVEEPVAEADSVLAHAVSRVLAQAVVGGVGGGGGGNSTRPTRTTKTTTTGSAQGADSDSASSSRAASVQRGRRSRRDSRTEGPSDEAARTPETMADRLDQLPKTPSVEGVSRGECKTVLLSALEEVVRDVVRGREGREQTNSLLQRAVQGWLDAADTV